MKNSILFVLANFLFCLCLQSQTPEWDNPLVNQLNKEYPRADFYHYPNEKIALSNNHSASSWFMQLNGEWQFRWLPNPASCSKDFMQPLADTGAWNKIAVPSDWKMKGFGKQIKSENSNLFKGSFPEISKDNNPVGLYRRYFPIPEDWFGRQIFIRFEGVSQAYYVWLNGKLIGYSEDSKTGSEYNITPYAKFGRINNLTVQVLSSCDGSWLENTVLQPMYGIIGNVCAYSLDNAAIGDFFVNAGLNENYTDGVFKLSVVLKKYLKSAKGKFNLIVSIKDKENKDVMAPLEREINVSHKKDSVVKFEQIVPKVFQWSAEKPYLYTMTILLKDKEENIVDAVCAKVGFRKIEIKNNNLLINGSKINFKSIDHYDNDTLKAIAFDEKLMIQFIGSLKQTNINVVRSCYFPANPRWLELCDEYGIYVIDDANIYLNEKDSALTNSITSKPEWHLTVLERTRDIFERDKNHPSVIIWSLGNGIKNGANFKDATEWIRSRDNSRLLNDEAAKLNNYAIGLGNFKHY